MIWDATGYDLQEFMFSKNLKAFYNRGIRRSMRVKFFWLNALNLPSSSQTLNLNVMDTEPKQKQMEVGNSKEIRNPSIETEPKHLPLSFLRRLSKNGLDNKLILKLWLRKQPGMKIIYSTPPTFVKTLQSNLKTIFQGGLCYQTMNFSIPMEG